MNRSCNSILCRFGVHTADPYVHNIHDLIDLLEIALEVL